jgi:asparagine N-glycosylation enzyme membrane subunit Stt3
MMRAVRTPAPVSNLPASPAHAGAMPIAVPGDEDRADAGRARPSIRFLLAAGAVLALATLVRMVKWREALWGPEVVALDNDSLYHLRRALDVAAGRGLPTFDSEINWPYGGSVPWAPGFDLLGGAVGWAAGQPYSRASALAIATIPVVLGLAAVGLSMTLAWCAAPRAVRRPAAITAGLLAALVPQAIFSSRFAQTDHHVAEAVMVTALAVWAQLGVGGARRGKWYELAGAFLGAGSVLFFTGAPIYVALAAAPLMIGALVGERDVPLVGRGAVGLVAGGVLALVASAPMVASHGRAVSFAFPSYLQPALVALAGIGIALACIAARAATLRRRVTALVALTVAAAALAALVPGVVAQVVDGVRGWLLARDPWIASIEEFHPAWQFPGGLPRLRALWGLAGFALPFLAVFAAAASWRESPRRALALLFQSLAMAALACVQIRFGRPATPLLAASAAIALAALASWIPGHPIFARAAAPVLVLMLFAGDRAVWAATATQPLDKGDALVAAAFGLREVRPGESAPGVLAPWDMGHEVNVLARRPVVANGFGSYLDAAGYEEVQRAYTLSEADLLAWMERRRVGYVVAGISTFQGKVPGPGSGMPLTAEGNLGALDAVYLRGVPLAATILGGSGIPDAGVPHLTRLMPRFASLQIARELPFAVPVLWTFEAVAGARLRGRAPAHARVVLEIDLVERGRKHVWRAWTIAAEDGAFELTVPLPTGLVQPTLASGPVARLRAGSGEAVRIEVPEAAVRGGGVLDVGELQ